MHDICTYQVEVEGQVDEMTLNATSPVTVCARKTLSRSTFLSSQTDQSGLIGLMRHLHQQGYVLLSVLCLRPQNILEEYNECDGSDEGTSTA